MRRGTGLARRSSTCTRAAATAAACLVRLSVVRGRVIVVVVLPIVFVVAVHLNEADRRHAWQGLLLQLRV
jgi:hypothetical protein